MQLHVLAHLQVPARGLKLLERHEVPLHATPVRMALDLGDALLAAAEARRAGAECDGEVVALQPTHRR